MTASNLTGTADRYLSFDRDQWAALRASTPLTLDEADLESLRGINERIDLDEVAAVYLPLTRLLNLYVAATQNLHKASAAFLGTLAPKVPYVIGVAGSVAVGKSTFARILQALLARWPDHPTVELVTTDGFLYPNAELERRGLLQRKGFPESYDRRALMRFIADVKSGMPSVQAPMYSHLTYDVLPGSVSVRRPDVLIVEGLNVLQPPQVRPDGTSTGAISDYFDFSVYVDAPVEEIRTWYVQRFLRLRETAFADPKSYFHRYAALSDDEAVATARRIWEQINEPNLVENVLPTRDRATLVLSKGADHAVTGIRLRKI